MKNNYKKVKKSVSSKNKLLYYYWILGVVRHKNFIELIDFFLLDMEKNNLEKTQHFLILPNCNISFEL